MELQDDLMRPCSVCDEQISKQADKCPNCGQDYVAWTNPETKEVEYITPDELKEKPQTTSETLFTCFACIIMIPVAVFLWNLLTAMGC